MIKLWQWVRKWWAALAVGVGILVWAVLSVGAYNRETVSFVDALKVERYRQRVLELRRLREVLLAEDQADTAKVEAIDRELERNLEEIEAARDRANVDDDALAKEFAKLGF